MYRVVKEEAGRVCLAGWGGLGKVGGGGGRTPTSALSPRLRSPPPASSQLLPQSRRGRVWKGGWVSVQARGWVCKRAGECANVCAQHGGRERSCCCCRRRLYQYLYGSFHCGSDRNWKQSWWSWKVSTINKSPADKCSSEMLSSPPALALFSQKRSIQMLPYLRGMQLFPNWS